MRPYAERKEARIERLRARAARLVSESESAHATAHRMADAIPFGQPILVGHHSERRDRRYRERIRNTFVRAIEAAKEAHDCERRADAAEENQAISSDDPEAIQRLKEKLAAMRRGHERDREINVTIRTAKRHADKAGVPWEPMAVKALADMGIPEHVAQKLTRPDFAGRIGVPDYALANLSANIRSVDGRIRELEARAARPQQTAETFGNVTIEENDNRVQIFFPGKPSELIRSELKANGFRWAPSEGAWQRMASDNAWRIAKQIAQRGSQ